MKDCDFMRLQEPKRDDLYPKIAVFVSFFYIYIDVSTSMEHHLAALFYRVIIYFEYKAHQRIDRLDHA